MVDPAETLRRIEDLERHVDRTLRAYRIATERTINATRAPNKGVARGTRRLRQSIRRTIG